jgi:hypothetical protein
VGSFVPFADSHALLIERLLSRGERTLGCHNEVSYRQAQISAA